jgi:UPF0716 protein FxsA
MNVAKWLLLALLMLPLAELAAFIAVAAAYGFLTALGLLLAGTLAGVLVLRRAGGLHIARVRTVMSEGLEQGRFTALQADGTGGLILVGGFLLVIPGFITDLLGLLVLLAVLWRSLSVALNVTFGRGTPPGRADGVVDLEPEQWHRVNDPALPNRQTERGDRAP